MNTIQYYAVQYNRTTAQSYFNTGVSTAFPLPDSDRETCWLPGLGLEKHPPMVGPGLWDTQGAGGKGGGRGRGGAVRSSGWAALLGGNDNTQLCK